MRTPLAPLALAASCLAACGDPTAPSPNLRVVVATTGIDEDPDGYVASVANGSTRSVPANGVLAFLLEAGTYEIRIDGVAPNCTVQGPASVSATIQRGLPAEVSFRVECRAVTGVIEVLTASSGRDVPPSYAVSMTYPSGGSRLTNIASNGATDLMNVAPGQYELRLSSVGANCAPTGEDTRTVSVTAGGLVRDTARAEFAVACQATTGDVRLSVTTTGTPADPDGYTVKLDGVLVEVPDPYYDYYDFYGYGGMVTLRLATSGSHLFERLAPGDHTIELGDVAGTCAADAPQPRTVSVSLGTVSELAINVVCGTAP